MLAKNIYGKRILFLSPSFFGYEIKIMEKMESMGATVDYYDERSITKARDKAILKVAPVVFYKKTNNYYNNIINDVKNNEYDFVLVIKGEMITEKILKDLKELFPKAVFCLYLWDSLKNVSGIKKKLKFYDRVFSFDREDTEKNNFIKFRPLFYIDEYKNQTKPLVENYKYDLSFVGTAHSDRFSIIKNVSELSAAMDLKGFFYCFLQSDFIYYFYKFTKKEYRFTKKTEFNFTPLSSSDISNIVITSKAILDIQHPNQSGLTMRTIEMLGMNKKIITTNKEIKKYDFYNPNNILVIERERIEIPRSFFQKDYESLSDDVYRNYSIDKWISDILY